MRPGLAVAAILLAVTATAGDAAVLCGVRGRDGSFSSGVKIREQCRPREVRLGVLQLDPLVVGEQPSSTSTTTTTSVTVAPSTVTSTTVSQSCGDGIIAPGETCDCAHTAGNACAPDPFSNFGFDSGGCPLTADGRRQQCSSDCTTCFPAPRCGDGVYDPGDQCDYALGIQGDNCVLGGRCIGTDGAGHCLCVGGPTTTTIP